MFEDRVLDRRVPTDWDHIQKYPLRAASFEISDVPASFEKILDVPRAYRDEYDQGKEGACCGYSLSWTMSILNRNLYDAFRLYAAAQGIDEWPDTPPQGGTSVRATFDVLRTKGHWRVYAGKTRSPQLTAGIQRNEWIRTVDQARTSIWNGVPVNLGINWPQGFFRPLARPRLDRAKNLGFKDYWIGEEDWGRNAGGHAIALVGVSDNRQAFALCNTWGESWPFLVWFAYDSYERSMREDGEAGVVVDR